jgi:hypothetical protein
MLRQLVDLAFELGDRPFEIEKMAHQPLIQSLSLRQRMRRFDQPAQPLALHMRIDLRRRNIGVSEHLLHASEVGPVIEQMAGKGMTQHMGRQPGRIEPGGKGQLLEHLAAALPCQMADRAA